MVFCTNKATCFQACFLLKRISTMKCNSINNYDSIVVFPSLGTPFVSLQVSQYLIVGVTASRLEVYLHVNSSNRVGRHGKFTMVLYFVLFSVIGQIWVGWKQISMYNNKIIWNYQVYQVDNRALQCSLS